MPRKAFTVTNVYSSYIVVKSVGTGKIYDVYYEGKIGAETGDTVTIIIDDNSD